MRLLSLEAVHLPLSTLVCQELPPFDPFSDLWEDAGHRRGGEEAGVVERVDQVLRDLESAFDAALERHEDHAADDLALSLRQDSDLREALLDGRGWGLLLDGHVRPVVEIGEDYVAVEPGPDFVPAPYGSFMPSDHGRPPRLVSKTFREELRSRARLRSFMKCSVAEAGLYGRLALCGRDHIVIAKANGEVLVALDAIRSVRFSPGGSAGAP